LSRFPYPAAKIAGAISEAGGLYAGGKRQENEASMAEKIRQLKKYEEELATPKNELKNLKVEEAAAKEKLVQCKAGGSD